MLYFTTDILIHSFFLFSFQQTDKDKEESEKSFGDADGYLDETFEPWSSKRTGILAKYTTSEKLSITTVSVRTFYCTSLTSEGDGENLHHCSRNCKKKCVLKKAKKKNSEKFEYTNIWMTCY